ncbi:helix-turn-helix DNA binding domain protein [Gordonia phage Malisha]|nr:helix-turn-helix DNA binding domain protein [Gordonia phage Malisha]
MTRSRGIIADRIAKRQIRVGLLAHAGMPPKQIAKEVGCAIRTVRDDLEAMDMLPPRPTGRPRKEAP